MRRNKNQEFNLDKMEALAKEVESAVDAFDSKWNGDPPPCDEVKRDFIPVIESASRLLKEIDPQTIELVLQLHDTTEAIVEAYTYSHNLLFGCEES